MFRIRTERSSATSIPEPRTSHNITNVEVIERRGDLVDVRFNWHTMYFRYNTVDPYYGTSFYTIDFSGEHAADPPQDRGAEERLHPPRGRHLPLLKEGHGRPRSTANHQVALSFEDGVTRFITVRTTRPSPTRRTGQRINIPLDCRDGACGTCKALCESGTFDGGTYIDDALSPDEAAQGYVLPCSMKPRSDLVLQIATHLGRRQDQRGDPPRHRDRPDRLSPTTVAFDRRDRGPGRSWRSCPASTSTSRSRARTRRARTRSATPRTTRRWRSWSSSRRAG